MPLPLVVGEQQTEAVRELSDSISSVDSAGILGAGPLVRVRWQSAPAVVKFFESRDIFENETRALERLSGSAQAPGLHGCGAVRTTFVLEDQVGAGRRLECGFWLCRDWVEPGGRPRIPLIRPGAFATQLRTFSGECTERGLTVGDAKPENLCWDGDRLVWLDFGWFYPTASEYASKRNEAVCAELLERLGW